MAPLIPPFRREFDLARDVRGAANVLRLQPGVHIPELQQAARFWVKFNSAGTIAASFNVTSVTDNGAGDWTVNIATDFASADYAVVASGGYAAHGGGADEILSYNVTAQAAGSVQIQARDQGAALEDPDTLNAIFAVGFGAQ
jgi:hypothetical protein